MILKLVIIALGGGIGSVLRFIIQEIMTKWLPFLGFPIGTLIVNVIGCFLIGIFFAMGQSISGLSLELKLFFITGICGGFTTFSTFSIESFLLLKQGDYFLFILYVFLSFGLGLLATIGGFYLFK